MGGATIVTRDVAALLADRRQPGQHLRREHDRSRRRGFPADHHGDPRAYRVLLRATSTRGGPDPPRAEGPIDEEVRDLVAFIRSSKRGVILSRRRGAADEGRSGDAAPAGGEPLGLIAGNGRFPFLVADAARRGGAKRGGDRDTGGDRPASSRREVDPLQWVGLGQLGPRDRGPASGGGARGHHGGPGEAPSDLLGHRARPEAAGRPGPPGLAEHRQPDRRGRRRAREGGHHLLPSVAFLRDELATPGR